MAEPPELVLVDDGLVHGGGQLGLGRYLREASAFRRELVLLAPNRVADEAGEVPVTVLQRGGSRFGLPLAWLRLIARQARPGRGQVVVANSLMAAIVLAATPKRGRRFVYYMREDFSPGWLSGPKRQVVQRFVFPRYDGFLANSAWTGSTLPAGRRGQRRVEVAQPLSGVPAGSPELPAPAGPELRVLSLSRIARWKGIDLVLDAAAALAADRPVRLTIAGAVAAGDEDYARALRDRDLRAGLHVEYTGHVDDVAGLLAGHDVLVVASRHPEPFGQVVIQGLAAGLVVVASDHGGPVDVLADEPLGRLVAPDDADALADTLRAIAADPPSPQARRDSAARARERYADAALAARFDTAVRAALADTRS